MLGHDAIALALPNSKYTELAFVVIFQNQMHPHPQTRARTHAPVRPYRIAHILYESA